MSTICSALRVLILVFIYTTSLEGVSEQNLNQNRQTLDLVDILEQHVVELLKGHVVRVEHFLI